ncbi:hypothetical protein [Azospirillum endophyticum]
MACPLRGFAAWTGTVAGFRIPVKMSTTRPWPAAIARVRGMHLRCGTRRGRSLR